MHDSYAHRLAAMKLCKGTCPVCPCRQTRPTQDEPVCTARLWSAAFLCLPVYVKMS